MNCSTLLPFSEQVYGIMILYTYHRILVLFTYANIYCSKLHNLPNMQLKFLFT
jgi:hypothetical protein